MSEVNADGVLLNPHEAILQEVQALSNALMAETPAGMEDDMEHEIEAANGEPAGMVGGAPHMPPATAAPARSARARGDRPVGPPDGRGDAETGGPVRQGGKEGDKTKAESKNKRPVPAEAGGVQIDR